VVLRKTRKQADAEKAHQKYLARLETSFDLNKLFREHEKKVTKIPKKPVQLAIRGIVWNMFNLLKGMQRNAVFNIESTYSILNDSNLAFSNDSDIRILTNLATKVQNQMHLLQKHMDHMNSIQSKAQRKRRHPNDIKAFLRYKRENARSCKKKRRCSIQLSKTRLNSWNVPKSYIRRNSTIITEGFYDFDQAVHPVECTLNNFSDDEASDILYAFSTNAMGTCTGKYGVSI